MTQQSSTSSQNFKLPKSSKIICPNITIGKNVVFGENVTLAGDDIYIGDNVRIANGANIRSHSLYIGAGSDIAQNVKVLVADRFEIGQASRISSNTTITCRRFVAKKFLYVGNDFAVGYGGTYESTSIVELGERVALGPHTILNANHKIVMGDDVGSGSYVSIWTHGFHFGHSVLDGYPLAHEGVVIERNVWLGFHVTVLPAATIGENTIVAACSVVSKPLPANCLAAGAPAVAKRELQQKPLNALDSYNMLSDFIKKWAIELQWKGLNAEFNLGYLEIKSSTKTTILQIIDQDHAPFFSEDTHHHILIAPSKSYDYINLSEQAESVVLFNIRERSVYGERDDIAEDLRDFLRRHTLSCGDDKVFSSIESIAFQRLREMV
jgi:acetyltransferase-like isoleucine patch superfamily enzyme